jgi:hypothetical protein
MATQFCGDGNLPGEGNLPGDDKLLGRSVMKWGADGELSALDLQQILTQLSSVDQQAAALMACPVDPA